MTSETISLTSVPRTRLEDVVRATLDLNGYSVPFSDHSGGGGGGGGFIIVERGVYDRIEAASKAVLQHVGLDVDPPRTPSCYPAQTQALPHQSLQKKKRRSAVKRAGTPGPKPQAATVRMLELHEQGLTTGQIAMALRKEGLGMRSGGWYTAQHVWNRLSAQGCFLDRTPATVDA